MNPGFRRFPVSASMLAAASIALGPPATAADEPLVPAPAELRLVWTDLCGTGPLTVQGATRELQALLGPLGIRLVSESSDSGRSRETRGLRLVLMPSNPNRLRRGAPAAGATLVRREQVNAAWVFPGAVAVALGLDIRDLNGWDLRTRLQFHRALAVVVAHELGHALAGAAHSQQGLMVPCLGRDEMLDRSLTVSPALGPALLAGVARLAGVATASEPTADPKLIALSPP